MLRPGWGQLTAEQTGSGRRSAPNIASELQPGPKGGKANLTGPNRKQTVRQAYSALGWLSSHTHAIFGGVVKFGLVLWKPL